MKLASLSLCIFIVTAALFCTHDAYYFNLRKIYSRSKNLKMCNPRVNNFEKCKPILRTVISIGTALSIMSPFSSFAFSDETLQQAESQTIKVFEESTPSTVYINTYVEKIDYFNMNVMEVPAGTGSGFIWDKEGHIVTNFHVIKNAATAKVTITSDDSTHSTKTFKATVVGIDPDKDVAVLSVDLKDEDKLSAAASWSSLPIKLKPVKIGSSTNLKVGQVALAIGNPFGLDHTLTTGIVSGLGREVRSPSNRPISNVIQTDAAINPGNSGGPLLDSRGYLIGMNTAIFTLSGSSAGIGFAIPVDTLKYEVSTLIRDGKVVRPALGITYLESSKARMLGINSGILVLNAPPGSPAQRAGIRGTKRSESGTNIGNIDLGDIIIGINDDKINSESDLFKAIEKYNVGDRITLRILRAANGDDNAEPSDKEKDSGNYKEKAFLSLKPMDIDILLTLPNDFIFRTVEVS